MAILKQAEQSTLSVFITEVKRTFFMTDKLGQLPLLTFAFMMCYSGKLF